MTTPEPHAHGPAHDGHAHADHPGHGGHEAHPHGAKPATEPERIAMVPLIAVGVVSVLVFALGSLWALRIRGATERAMNPTGAAVVMPKGYGAEEQGIVDQIPFELNTWVAKDRKENGGKLQGYRWIDAQAGTVHVPIERAMELIVEESHK